MENKRLTVNLDYDVWNVLQLQATVLEKSLGRHINSILRQHLEIEDPAIADAILRLQRQGRTEYMSTRAEVIDGLGGETKFEVQGDSLDGASSRLSTHHGASKYSSV